MGIVWWLQTDKGTGVDMKSKRSSSFYLGSRRVWLLVMTAGWSLWMNGCASWGFGQGSDALTNEVGAESLFSEAELDYEVPVSVPNILVNQLGYLPDSEKMAVFRGEELPETFQIIDAKTGEAVFEGTLEDRGYNTYFEEYNSYGIFTEVTKPGNYYVEAQVVGRSYFFTIESGLYNPVARDAVKQYYFNRCGITLTGEYAGERSHSACHTQKVPFRDNAEESLDVSGGWHQDQNGSKDLVRACSVVNTLLLAYELNEGAFGDDGAIPESGNLIPDLLDEIRYEIDWLLKMQDVGTGGVFAGISVYRTDETSETAYIEPISPEATQMYCAAMAKFSYLYQGFDSIYATDCLKAADRAWRYLENNISDPSGEGYFLAATEMYRASGYQTYHRVITQYLKQPQGGILNSEVSGNNSNSNDSSSANEVSINENVMMGYVTYLSTKKYVDKNLCSEIMKIIMSEAEGIAARTRQSPYLTAGNRQQDNNTELLTDMFYLSIVNHIIRNHEYGTVIENHLHYLMGRNSEGISYIDGIGAKNYLEIEVRLGIMNQIEPDSKLIFMLSEIKSNSDQIE
ncbi:MAG: glycoside hydrolase family 9 protein [Lachnospiraceae bacterium]|jgi:endoglucanase|nr:glycoside hydrolase family 9 protein [Lachnospiraceae bacterium]